MSPGCTAQSWSEHSALPDVAHTSHDTNHPNQGSGGPHPQPTPSRRLPTPEPTPKCGAHARCLHKATLISSRLIRAAPCAVRLTGGVAAHHADDSIQIFD